MAQIIRWMRSFGVALLILTGLATMPSTAAAQCDNAACGDGRCAVECGECEICQECMTPEAMLACENLVFPQDIGLPGEPGRDAGAPDGPGDPGGDPGDPGGGPGDPDDPGDGDPVDEDEPCANRFCGDGRCDAECGECDGCMDCPNPDEQPECGGGRDGDPDDDDPCAGAVCGDLRCSPECDECDGCADCEGPAGRVQCDPNAFDFTDCENGVYYESMGFPEVSDGAPCSNGNCPTYEEFCADPAHRGVGVTACTFANPCGEGPDGMLGGGTPMPCPCGEGELECRELGPDGQPRPGVDECQNDCDCVGSPNGGRCREDPICGNICDMRCLNRNNFQFPNQAFSSCEFPCPTARLPANGNPGRPYFRQLPDHCKGGTNACLNPAATPLTPAAQPQRPDEACGFYLSLRQCFNDCGACEKNRLEGYYHMCSNNNRLANGGRIPGLGGFYNQCGLNRDYRDYAAGMMFCLQVKAVQGIEDRCASCNELVSGLPNIDIESGIIGAHTECNDVMGFCGLARDPGGVPLRCFGAALGRSWGTILGHHSPIGTAQPVGVCHLMSQLVACAEGDPLNLARWQGQICQGFVDGCMTQMNLVDHFPDCNIPGVGSCRNILRRKLCQASCPIVPAAGLVGILDLGVDGALAFERACNSLLTEGVSIFGFPIIPPIGEVGLPGTGSGRDPCLTY